MLIGTGHLAVRSVADVRNGAFSSVHEADYWVRAPKDGLFATPETRTPYEPYDTSENNLLQLTTLKMTTVERSKPLGFV